MPVAPDLLEISQKTTPPAVPLSWAAGSKAGLCNFGDALSPIMVSALSGWTCKLANRDAASTRMACIGTIGHGLSNGKIHFWGTGGTIPQELDAAVPLYVRPPNTEFHVHATRGPYSADAMRRTGIECPEIYGDPAWFLPAMWPAAPEKTHELGVILHLSEVPDRTLEAGPHEHFVRYQIPAEYAGKIRLINTFATSSVAGIRAKIDEITSCKRIVSTSLHGLILAEAYRIPCLYFGTATGRGQVLDVTDPAAKLNHRFRDFTAGVGQKFLKAYHFPRTKPTPWHHVIKTVDEMWEPLEFNAAPLAEAFPLPLAWNPLSGEPFPQTHADVLETLKF